MLKFADGSALSIYLKDFFVIVSHSGIHRGYQAMCIEYHVSPILQS